MLARRLRRRASIRTALGQRVVFADRVSTRVAPVFDHWSLSHNVPDICVCASS